MPTCRASPLHLTRPQNLIPRVLYNIPGRTVSNVAPDTIARLAENEFIVGVKEASGDINQIA